MEHKSRMLFEDSNNFDRVDRDKAYEAIGLPPTYYESLNGTLQPAPLPPAPLPPTSTSCYDQKQNNRVEVLPQPGESALPEQNTNNVTTQNSSAEDAYTEMSVQLRVKKAIKEEGTIANVVVLGSNPSIINCRNCQYKGKTRVTYKANCHTHVFAALLGLVGWCCCLCCIPYCTNSNRTAKHYCKRCGIFYGIYEPNSLR